MALTKTLQSKTLAIEVETGKDKAGDPIYGKKSFSGVKIASTDEAIFNVANAIKTVLAPTTGEVYLNEVELVENV